MKTQHKRRTIGVHLLLLGLLVAALSGCSSDKGLPIADIQSSHENYDTIKEVAADSSIVMLATVSGVEELGVLELDEAPEPSEWVILTFTSDEVLLGTDPGKVTLVWETFVTDGTGGRMLELTFNGVATPEVGDSYLLFLEPERENRAKVFGNRSTHKLVASYAMMALDQGVVRTEYTGGSEVGLQLDDYSIKDIRAFLNE